MDTNWRGVRESHDYVGDHYWNRRPTTLSAPRVRRIPTVILVGLYGFLLGALGLAIFADALGRVQ